MYALKKHSLYGRFYCCKSQNYMNLMISGHLSQNCIVWIHTFPPFLGLKSKPVVNYFNFKWIIVINLIRWYIKSQLLDVLKLSKAKLIHFAFCCCGFITVKPLNSKQWLTRWLRSVVKGLRLLQFFFFPLVHPLLTKE